MSHVIWYMLEVYSWRPFQSYYFPDNGKYYTCRCFKKGYSVRYIHYSVSTLHQIWLMGGRKMQMAPELHIDIIKLNIILSVHERGRVKWACEYKTHFYGHHLLVHLSIHYEIWFISVLVRVIVIHAIVYTHFTEWTSACGLTRQHCRWMKWGIYVRYMTSHSAKPSPNISSEFYNGPK